MSSDYDDLREKQEFVETVMSAVMIAGYPDPGYYVDEYNGQPCIYDSTGTPRQSLSGDSPTAVIVDLAEVIKADR